MSYLNKIDVQLVELPVMYLVSIRKMVYKFEMEEQYAYCFNSILRKIQYDKLTATAPPMVLFHSDEFTPLGLDTEFAIPVKQFVTGTRDFYPGLCLKQLYMADILICHLFIRNNVNGQNRMVMKTMVPFMKFILLTQHKLQTKMNL